MYINTRHLCASFRTSHLGVASKVLVRIDIPPNLLPLSMHHRQEVVAVPAASGCEEEANVLLGPCLGNGKGFDLVWFFLDS